MLRHASPLSRLLLRTCSGQPAVLASAYATSSGAARPDDSGSSNSSRDSEAFANLHRLKQRLAGGPDLDEFLSGGSGNPTADAYSVYAPNFKVSRA